MSDWETERPTQSQVLVSCVGSPGDRAAYAISGEEDTMLMIIAFIIELLVSVCAMWLLIFLSTFLHELGHALGYMLATGDRNWHIRVGWGKRLLYTKALTVNLLVFDGVFTPSVKEFDTKAKLITTLSGGPAVSLLLVLGLLGLRFGGASFQSDILADGTIEFFLNSALFLNLYILILSVLPVHYFFGEIKGMETDGLQIIRAMRKDGD